MTTCSPFNGYGAQLAALKEQVEENTGAISNLESFSLIDIANATAYDGLTTTSAAANGFPLISNVIWPDGQPGVLTAVEDPAWPGAVRSYVVTYGSPVIKTLTQPVLTRNNIDGRVTVKPRIIVS